MVKKNSGGVFTVGKMTAMENIVQLSALRMQRSKLYLFKKCRTASSGNNP